MSNLQRNEKILMLMGHWSYSEIAKKLHTTRSVVAGVIYRHKWPYRKRVQRQLERRR